MKRVASTTNLVRAAAMAAVAATVAACGSAGPSETFYVLDDGGAVIASTASPKTPAGVKGPAPLAIVIGSVTVPEMVDRPQIVTRDGTNRAVVSEQNLWVESVRAGIRRTLAARLSNAMAGAGRPAQVAAAPQATIVDPTLRITVDVVRFDAVPNGQAVVEALYTVRRVKDGAVRVGRTSASASISGVGYEAIVQGWNEAVQTVERDIAKLALEMTE